MGAGTYENAWTPGPAEGGGLHLPHGLAVRRPAGVDAHALRPDTLRAVSRGAQRLAADHPPPAHRRASSATCSWTSSRRWSEQSAKYPLVCNLSIHPFVFGYPFRLRPLRKALQHCFGEQVHRIASGSASRGTSPTTATRWSRGSFRGAEMKPPRCPQMAAYETQKSIEPQITRRYTRMISKADQPTDEHR